MRGDGPHRQGLRGGYRGHFGGFAVGTGRARRRVVDGLRERNLCVSLEVLNHALAGQYHREQRSERQQNVERDAGYVNPKITDGIDAVARKAANQRKGHRHAGGR